VVWGSVLAGIIAVLALGYATQYIDKKHVVTRAAIDAILPTALLAGLMAVVFWALQIPWWYFAFGVAMGFLFLVEKKIRSVGGKE